MTRRSRSRSREWPARQPRYLRATPTEGSLSLSRTSLALIFRILFCFRIVAIDFARTRFAAPGVGTFSSSSRTRLQRCHPESRLPLREAVRSKMANRSTSPLANLASQLQRSASPSPLCGIWRSPKISPSESITQTWWISVASLLPQIDLEVWTWSPPSLKFFEKCRQLRCQAAPVLALFGANTPLDVHRGCLAEAQVPPRYSRHRGDRLLSAGRRRRLQGNGSLRRQHTENGTGAFP